MRIDSAVYKEIDEIDHITIRVRKGEALDRKTAVKMIKRYSACFECVKNAFEGADVSLEALNASGDKELYDALIKTRTALIDTVL